MDSVDIEKQRKHNWQIIDRCRGALVLARSQLVVLGGNTRKHPEDEQDRIQAKVLEHIDAVLQETE